MGYWSQSQASSLLWRCSLCELLSHLEWTDNNAGDALRRGYLVIEDLLPWWSVSWTLLSVWMVHYQQRLHKTKDMTQATSTLLYILSLYLVPVWRPSDGRQEASMPSSVEGSSRGHRRSFSTCSPFYLWVFSGCTHLQRRHVYREVYTLLLLLLHTPDLNMIDFYILSSHRGTFYGLISATFVGREDLKHNKIPITGRSAATSVSGTAPLHHIVLGTEKEAPLW